MRMSVDYEDAPTSPTSHKLRTARFHILHRLFEFTQNHDFRNTFILSQKLPQQHRHKSTKKKKKIHLAAPNQPTTSRRE